MLLDIPRERRQSEKEKKFFVPELIAQRDEEAS